MGVRLLFVLGILIPGLSNATTARKPASKKSPATITVGACDSLLLKNEALAGLSARFEELPFDVLLSADPESNIAVRHPSIVMDMNQITYQAILKYPARKIKDPTYPVVEHEYYPIFSGNVPEAGGAMILGQYEAIKKFVEFVELRASGQAQDNALLFTGPAGTGKTEFLTITERVIANLSASNPDFFQYTFKFVGLENVPKLRSIVDEDTGTYLIQTPPDSPLTLLDFAPGLRDRIVQMAAPRVKKLIKLSPQPWTHMHPQVAQIMLELIHHHYPGVVQLTDTQYVNILRQHVRIIRHYIDPNRPAVTVDFQGDHPDPGLLFGSENPILTYVLGQANPLSWRYDGKVMQLHGRVGVFDELFRNKPEMLNFSLKIIQSGVVEANGAPAVYLNTVPVAATNDESLMAAREEGGTKALLNRFMKEPMRQPIHPVLASATALWMSSDRKIHQMFQMTSLSEPDAASEPADINRLYPQPTDRGVLLGPDQRYALHYVPNEETRILIAPHALELLGLTVASTRLETDPKALAPHEAKLKDLALNMNVFQDVTQRMKTIRRDVQQQGAVYRDLRDVMFLLREGEKGISARDAKRWLLKALMMAKSRGSSAVTPVTIDRALEDMVKKGEFDDLKLDVSARWVRIHSKIKTDFVLPALTADIQAIVGGDSGLVDKLYNEVKEEILVLASQPDGDEWSDEGGERHPIMRDRLKEIGEIYERINNESFNLTKVKSFITARGGGEVFGPLRMAVENFLLQKELSTSTMNELLDFFDGRSVSEETRLRGQMASNSMARFGYDKQSFREALAFVKDVQHELRTRQRQGR